MRILHHREVGVLRTLMIVGLLTVGISQAAATEQFVVLSAEPPSKELGQGTIISLGDTLNIPSGTTVSLLGQDGSVSEVSGPRAFLVTPESIGSNEQPSTVARSLSKLNLVAGLLARERQTAESIGGARGTEVLEDPWAISIEESASGCIKDSVLRLVRKRPGDSYLFQLRLGETVLRDPVWRAGEATYLLLAMPPDTTRVLTIETLGRFVQIEIRSMPVHHRNPLDILSWMISVGCDRQALALTRQLAMKKN